MDKPKPRGFVEGDLESMKFVSLRDSYYRGVEIMKGLGYEFEDFLHEFPCFVGSMTLSRYLALYECYQKTLGLAGHIADVGVYKGSSLLFFAKLAKIFEPTAFTQVHGFDWFKGSDPGPLEPKMIKGGALESYERVKQLIEAQSVENIIRLHKLDVTKDLPSFLERYPHLRFKLVFLDVGVYEAVKASITMLWDRLTVGGYLIFDHYNFEITPGETKAIQELLPERQVRTFPYSPQPTGYIVK